MAITLCLSVCLAVCLSRTLLKKYCLDHYQTSPVDREPLDIFFVFSDVIQDGRHGRHLDIQFRTAPPEL